MGPILSRAETSKVIERTGNGWTSAASACVNGFRVSMEDAHTMTLPEGEGGGNKRCVFGVFDGHSNETCSAFVAQHLPPVLMKLPKDAANGVIEQAFLDTDAKYMSDDKGGGTTAAVAILDTNEANKSDMTLTVCNTGDSRVMVIREGQIAFVTEDHKPANPGERDRIEQAGGMVRMNRVDGELAVSRAFGDSMFKRSVEDPRKTKVICVPEITKVQVKPNDIVLICCDGVFESNFTNEQVCEFTTRQLNGVGRAEVWTKSGDAPDLAVTAANLCDQAIRRGSKDNISAMVVKLGVDGTNAAEKFGHVSYVPGPPPLRNNTNSRNAFEKMAKMAGLNLGQALQRRFELLKSRQQLAPPKFAEVDAHAFDLQDPLDVDTEERYFGGGPGEEEKDPIQWFEELTQS